MFSPILSRSPSLPTSSPLKTEQHNIRDGQYADGELGSSRRNITENLNLIANNAATFTRNQAQEIATPIYAPTGLMTCISNTLDSNKEITPYSGAYLAEIMDASENELLFLPDIKSISSEKENNKEDSTTHVTMSQLHISKSVFLDRINALINKTAFFADFLEKVRDMTLNNAGLDHRDIDKHQATVKTPDHAMLLLHQKTKKALKRAKNAVKSTLKNIINETTTRKRMKTDEAIKPPASSSLTKQDKNREIEYRLKKIKAFRAALDMKKIEQRLSAIRQFNLDSYAAEQGRGASNEQGTAMRTPHDHKSK